MSKTNEKWTKEHVLADAKKYSSLKEWKTNSPSAVCASRRHKIYYEATAHMPRIVRRWTNEEVIEDAKRYSTRNEWRKKSVGYQLAIKRNLLNKACAHMKRLGNRFKRQIYAIENSDKSVYVGLSANPNRRYREHVSYESKQACDKILREYYLSGNQKLQIFDIFHSPEDAALKEGHYIAKYRDEGWKILNSAKPGALGTPIKIYTLKYCIELAKDCTSRTEFCDKYPSAYGAVCNNQWASIVFSELPSKVRAQYTYEEVSQAAQQCKSRIQFFNDYPNNYAAAQRMNILDEICAHMEPPKTRSIPHEQIIEAAQKCSTIKEFEKKYPSEYHAARSKTQKKDPIYWKQVAGHLKKLRVAKWTEEDIREDAKKYASYDEWRKARRTTTYKAARVRNLLYNIKKNWE